MIDIARATIEAALLLADLSTVTFIQTYTGTCSDEDMVEFLEYNFQESILEQELSNNENHLYLAFVDECPAGFIRFKEVDTLIDAKPGKSVFLKSLYVLNEFHRQKVGTALLEFIIELAAIKSVDSGLSK